MRFRKCFAWRCRAEISVSKAPNELPVRIARERFSGPVTIRFVATWMGGISAGIHPSRPDGAGDITIKAKGEGW